MWTSEVLYFVHITGDLLSPPSLSPSQSGAASTQPGAGVGDILDLVEADKDAASSSKPAAGISTGTV